MKTTKKMLALLLAAAMILAMTACGSSSDSSTDTTAAADDTTAAVEDTTGEAEDSTDEATEAEEGSEAADTENQSTSSEAPTLTSTEEVNIIWSHNASETSSGHQVALKFKERIEELSDGKITVTIYPNGQLGTVTENDQAMHDGTIQILSGTAGSTTDASLSYFDAPNLVNSDEEALELFGRGTELREMTEEIYEGLGMKILSFMPSGFREVTSNVEIRSYEELAGLDIRTMENTVSMEYWSDWGCNPTPLAFSELYIALQQGLVDAQENTYDTIVSSNLYEQQKYVINTNHVVMWSGVYINLDFFNSLPEDYQELITWIWEYELDEVSYEMAMEANEEALQTMIDAGLEVIDFADEDYVKMRETASPAYDLIRESVGDEIMDKVMAALE